MKKEEASIKESRGQLWETKVFPNLKDGAEIRKSLLGKMRPMESCCFWVNCFSTSAQRLQSCKESFGSLGVRSGIQTYISLDEVLIKSIHRSYAKKR